MSFSRSTQLPILKWSAVTRITNLLRTNDFVVACLLTLLCMVTRVLAIPASLWEWDDILFARALHRFDLIAHSPHPPGFPVFVLLTRGVFWILHDEHRALVIAAFTFSSFLTGVLFYFYRQIFKDRQIAIAGALLGSFIPNVWIYSCAGRSDAPALVLGILASTLVLHGLKSRRSLLIGCALLGLGMGVRVTILFVVAPMLAMVLLIRLSSREWRLILQALSIIAFCILIWYLPMIWHQTWRTYSSVVANHRNYIWRTDSMFAPNGNSILSYRFIRYYNDVWGAQWIRDLTYALAAVGVLVLAIQRRWQTLGWMAVGFLPYMCFSFAITAPMASPLYSLPYMPLFTGLAAYGAIKFPRLLSTKLSNSGLVFMTALTICVAGWTYPIIKMMHHRVSPSLSAIHYLQQTLDPEHDLLIYDGVFSPHVSLYLSRFRTILRSESKPARTTRPDHSAGDLNLVYLTESPLSQLSIQHFSWEEERGARRLWRLSLGRYFDAYITRVPKEMAEFEMSEEEAKAIK